MNHFQFIDVSGVGNSGKSAAVDLLREFQPFFVPDNTFEFDLFRSPGGVLDLKHHLCDDWSPIRSNQAVNDFKATTRIMGLSPNRLNLIQISRSSGQRLNDHFKQDFVKLSEDLANSFVIGNYPAYWPYNIYRASNFERFTAKFFRKLKFHKSSRSNVSLVSGNDFDKKITSYINILFSQITPSKKSHVIFNNAFEPFSPKRSLDILQHSKSIIVTRDPRDVYVSGLNAHSVDKKDIHLQASENDGINKSFLASDNIELFVKRYRLYMKNVSTIDDSRILILRFEDIITNYDSIILKLYNFLDVPSDIHKFKGKYLDPNISRRNIGIWKKFSKNDEVKFIENNLSEFLWSEK